MTNEEKKLTIDTTCAALGLGLLAATGIVYLNKNNSDKAISVLIVSGFLSVFIAPVVLKKTIL